MKIVQAVFSPRHPHRSLSTPASGKAATSNKGGHESIPIVTLDTCKYYLNYFVRYSLIRNLFSFLLGVHLSRIKEFSTDRAKCPSIKTRYGFKKVKPIPL